MTRIETISAIVTTFNSGRLVLDTVESLRRQSRPPSEIVVVDDASTDPDTIGTLSELETCGIEVLRQPANGGVSSARNRGIHATRGDAFVLLDGDDMFERDALAAFAAALDDAPDAGFAYPTVRAFGNRNDTFVAPRFNLYALHHVNICPIASMVRRSVPEAGIHFADGINPEDWDYWLRASAEGFLGVAAPDAVLLWRRWGFTRLAEATRGEGLAAPIRRQRPDLFEAERLARIKSEWAPALAIVAADGPGGHVPQVCGDYRVVSADRLDGLNSSNVMLLRAELGDLLSDELVVERIVDAHHGSLGAEFVLLIDPTALRTPLPVGSPLSIDDLKKEWLKEESVVGVSARRSKETWPRMPEGCDPFSAFLEAARRRSRTNPHAVVALAGPAASDGARGTSFAELVREMRDTDWMAEVLAGLPPLTTWRAYGGTGGAVSPSMVSLRQVTDPAGGLSLFAPDEELPTGVTPGGPVAAVHTESHYGLIPLHRVVHSDGRRGLAAKPGSSTGVEALVGHIEAAPTPGSMPLLGDAGVLGWAYPAVGVEARLAVDTVPVGSQRPIWRALDVRTGLHRYGSLRELRAMPGLPIETIAMWVELDPSADGPWVALYPLLDDRTLPARGFAPSSGPNFPGVSVGAEPVGYLLSRPASGSREIALRRAEANGDILCTHESDEGSDVGFVTVRTLGFEGV